MDTVDKSKLNKKFKFSYSQKILAGFIIIIFIGGVLLMFPVSSSEGKYTPFLNALFTSASACCVTGLVVYDTFTHWSLFGQIVILLLIQLGGLGFMVFAAAGAILTKKKLGLGQRELMQEAVNANQVGGIVRLFKMILKGTLICEGAGTIFLSVKFIPMLGIGEGLYYSLFHSVSAFCSAGFDLMGKFGNSPSMSYFKEDIYVNIVLMILVTIGGIGFYVWEDLFTQKFKFKKLRLHTKLVLVTTAILIIFPTVLFLIFERNKAFSGLDPIHAVFAALFESVSVRTVGFDMIGQEKLSDSSTIIGTVLMLIGGSPGSTAGGIKTTTAAVLFLSALAELKNRRSVSVFERRLDDDLLRRAISIIVVYLVMAFTAAAVICHIEDMSLKEVVFEVFAAIGTVGLTMGLTPLLSSVSKVILMVLMLFGRIGGVSMAMAFVRPYIISPVEYPLEKISVG